jgi:hypothetical protein
VTCASSGVAYTGVYSRTVTRADLQTEMDAISYDTSSYFEVEQASTTHGYSNQVVPTSNITVLSVQYYDHYDFNRDGTPDYTYDADHFTGQEASASTRTRGMATGSKQTTIDDGGNVTGSWLVSTVFYDGYGRPIQTQGNNHLYSTVADKSTIIYDFTKVLKTKSSHYSSSTNVVHIVDRSDYDHVGRVVRVYRKINNDAEVQLAKYEYNALGTTSIRALRFIIIVEMILVFSFRCRL